MIISMIRENRTLRELILGTWIFGILMGIILAIFFPPVIYRLIGLACGLFAATGMAIHMAYCIDVSVELSEKGAGAHIRKMTIIRYLAVCVLLVILALTKIGDPVSYCIGALSLKIGAYSQPLVHKMTGGTKTEVNNEVTSADNTNDIVFTESELNNNYKGGE